MDVHAGGRIVVAGRTGTISSGHFALAGYDAGGNLDPSCDAGCKVTTDYGDNDGASGVALQPDGNIVAGGITRGAGDDFALARYVGKTAEVANPRAEITGNGTLRSNPQARFDLAARYKSRTQTFEGQITYDDHAGDLTFQSTEITSIDNMGDSATITGKGLANGTPVSFTITVSDVVPGLFAIRLSSGYSAESSLKQGRIRIADQC